MAPLFHVEALLPSSISPKIDSILHSHIYPQVGHVFRAVAKFKALLVDVILNKKKRTAAAGRAAAGAYDRSTKRSGSKKRTNKIACFVKMQFTSRSSSSPARARYQLEYESRSSYCEYSAPWSAAATEVEEVVEVCDGGDDATECGYLCWLEEEERPGGDEGAVHDDGDGDVAVNEIDRLAEKFIARFHAKFLLEKQESYRRYQDMIARSI
jgi:hypothetical protein